jgi:hypothetical protein
MKTLNPLSQQIKALILSKKIVTFEEIIRHTGVNARMTLIRKLREISYLTSYSHKGKYYSLESLPKFSEEGLWSYQSVYFSKFHTLLNTCYEFINSSESGYTTKELQNKLYVEVKLSLLKLYKTGKVYRKKINGEYVYFNKFYLRRKQQIILRQSQNKARVLTIDKLTSNFITDELKAAIMLFYSILDEKERRLYAGLESLKIGHGGNQLISELLGINPETVSKGRNELIRGDFEKNKTRKKGGGRPAIKKNT